jgi:hypothetical protein
MQPTRGPLYDYSAYFAANYPQLAGSAEFLPRQPYQGVRGPVGPAVPPGGYAAPPAWGR